MNCCVADQAYCILVCVALKRSVLKGCYIKNGVRHCDLALPMKTLAKFAFTQSSAAKVRVPA